MQYQFIFLKSQAGNLSHRGKVSKETEIALQGDKVLHHFWSKPVDLRAFLPRPADFHLCPARGNMGRPDHPWLPGAPSYPQFGPPFFRRQIGTSGSDKKAGILRSG